MLAKQFATGAGHPSGQPRSEKGFLRTLGVQDKLIFMNCVPAVDKRMSVDEKESVHIAVVTKFSSR